MTTRTMTPISDPVLHLLSAVRGDLPATLTGDQVQALHTFTEDVFRAGYESGYLRSQFMFHQQTEAARRAEVEQSASAIHAMPSDPPRLASLDRLSIAELLELAKVVGMLAVGTMDMPDRLASVVGLPEPNDEFSPSSVAGVDTVFDKQLANDEVRVASLVFRVRLHENAAHRVIEPGS